MCLILITKLVIKNKIRDRYCQKNFNFVWQKEMGEREGDDIT